MKCRNSGTKVDSTTPPVVDISGRLSARQLEFAVHSPVPAMKNVELSQQLKKLSRLFLDRRKGHSRAMLLQPLDRRDVRILRDPSQHEDAGSAHQQVPVTYRLQRR